MNYIGKIASFSVLIILAMAVPAFAADEGSGGWVLIEFSGAFGAALVTIGGAYAIGRLASSALESMARQPEVAGNIQTAMIIAAALIEGFTFFALVICMGQNPWG